MIVEFNGQARSEYEDAIEWYRAKSPPTAERFVEAVQSAFGNIAKDPQRFPRVRLGCQCCSLHPPFPFSIIFHHTTDHVLIVAVAHASRRPNYWHRRISN